MAVLSEISGVVSKEETRKNMIAISVSNEEEGETRVYQVPYSAGILVENGDHVDKGQELTRGALNPHDVLRIRGVNDDEFGRSGVRNYLVQEVQKVYRQQGVDINNKHIEVIVRQMMRKIRVEEPGDTGLLSGSQVDINEFKDENAKVAQRIAAGETDLKPATGAMVLLGITKASLATDSWMSAASFQETTKVLTDAAIKGKVDHLIGLKENVIIGKLIPAGSGLDVYRQFEIETDESVEEEADYVDLSELKKLTNAL
jgi:DNA-directed RNA polymerase subunit beta'